MLAFSTMMCLSFPWQNFWPGMRRLTHPLGVHAQLQLVGDTASVAHLRLQLARPLLRQRQASLGMLAVLHLHGRAAL